MSFQKTVNLMTKENIKTINAYFSMSAFQSRNVNANKFSLKLRTFKIIRVEVKELK